MSKLTCFIRAATCLTVIGGLSACAPDPVSTLFDEDGTWSLISFDKVGGSAFTELNENKENGFLMRFSNSAKKVAVASCQDQQEHDEGRPGDVDATLCAQAGRPDFWYCQCFTYAFEESQMCWAAGSGPAPDIDACVGGGGVDGGTGGGTGGTGGPPMGPSGQWTINVSEDTEAAATYIFQPLPQAHDGEPAVFGSTAGSRYRMQQKTNSLFEETACGTECGI